MRTTPLVVRRIDSQVLPACRALIPPPPPPLPPANPSSSRPLPQTHALRAWDKTTHFVQSPTKPMPTRLSISPHVHVLCLLAGVTTLDVRTIDLLTIPAKIERLLQAPLLHVVFDPFDAPLPLSCRLVQGILHHIWDSIELIA